MRKLNIVILTLVLVLSVAAQTKKTDRASDGLVGKVHIVVEDGAALSGSSDKPVEGARYHSESCTYDPSGNQIERIVYGGVGGTEIIEQAYYSLDSAGNRLEKSYMGGSGIPAPAASQPALSKQDKAADGAYLYKRVNKHDAQGNIVEEAMYRGGGAFDYKEVYKYDTKGRRVEWLTYDEKGATTSRNTYTYSGDGQFPDGETRDGGRKVKFVYEFDAQGNWTKRLELYVGQSPDKSKQIGEVTYRTITYYEADKAAAGKAQAGETKTVWVIPAGFKDISPYEVISVPPPSATPPPGVTAKTGVLYAGKPIKRVAPVYPPLAVQAKIVGTVSLEAIIDETGNVIWAKAVSGPPLLRDAAVEALRQWKFEPAMFDGAPVKVLGAFTLNFGK